MKTILKIAVGIILAVGLLAVGCVALIGGAANEIDKEIKEEEANDKPKPVAAGAAFTHDDFDVAAGWKVAAEQFGGTTIKGLRVTNNADEARHAQLTFTFVKGQENLGEIECSSNELQPGQSSRMDCFSFDGRIKGYDEIRVADMF